VTHLNKAPGFVEFHLLKGPEAEDHTLYASLTVWERGAVFSRTLPMLDKDHEWSKAVRPVETKMALTSIARGPSGFYIRTNRTKEGSYGQAA
jgi:hypothetical protein